MSKKILVINAGSSSIKFKIYVDGSYQVVASGLCERIFLDGRFELKYDGKVTSLNYAMPNHSAAIKCILEQLKAHSIIEDLHEIIGIGHRVVLSGSNITESMKVDAWVKEQIKENIKLAPLHNEPELKVIEDFEKLLPGVINVASFDNTFHSTIPPVNYVYPIDQTIAKKYAIRRYGFHGNSYRYITLKMQKLLNKEKVNLIVCHLGNGASISAIKESKSYATSMGLTPLEGVMMGTRSGDADPSIAIYLNRQGLKSDEIDTMLNKKSGLQALCGSSDMRDVNARYDKNDEVAKLTIQMYANRVAKYILDYANQLGGKFDAIVFTAGVGENSPFAVGHIINTIKIIKLKLDQSKLNQKYDDYKIISTSDSAYPIYCVRTDEELMIAQDVKDIINKK